MDLIIGETFTIDADNFHTLLVKFTEINETEEEKIQGHTNKHNGHMYYQSLYDNFELFSTVGIYINRDEHVLENMFYMGEKRPHMWLEDL